MASSRNARTSNKVVPIVLVLVVAVVGAATFLVLDAEVDPTSADDGPAVVQTETGEARSVETIEPAPTRDTAQPERLEVVAEVIPDPDVEAFVAPVGTPTSSIEGRCLDEQGEPVAGVALSVFKGNPLVNAAFPGTRQRLSVSATSGEDGSFVVAGVAAGKNYVLSGEHPDFARSELNGLNVPRTKARTGVVLRMEKGAVVRGRVVTLSDAAIVGARVELFDTLANARLRPEERRPWKIQMTDERGEFAFEHVSATSIKVRVESEGFEAQTRSMSHALEARPRNEELEFRLNEGTSLTGEVRDLQGLPVPNARIEGTSLTKEYQGNVIAFADDSGQFVLDGMGDHFYQMRVTARGYSDVVRPKVTLGDGHLVIEMDRRLAVEGFVTSSAGQAIPAFSLALYRHHPSRSPAPMNDMRTFENGEGFFLFDNLEPGSYRLEARTDGYAPTMSEPFTLTRGSHTPPKVNVYMVKGGTLRGTVTDSTGKPLQNALVKVNPNGHIDSPIIGIFAALAPQTEFHVQTRTNAEGAFELAHVTPGTYQVAVKHPDAAPLELNDVVVLDDDNGGNRELELELPPGAVVGGVALNENGTALPFAEVQLTRDSGFMESVTTDDEGGFRFDNLKQGTYALTLKPDRDPDSNEKMNPLLKLVFAQKSRKEVYVNAGQVVDDVELYLRRN